MSKAESDTRKFRSTLNGCVRMPGYMNVPVRLTLQAGARFNLVEAEVRHESLFFHRFSLDFEELVSALSESSNSGPVAGVCADVVVICAQTWHWQIPVEVGRAELRTFLAGVTDLRGD